jgi:surface carbohydrate biosynthesis protein
VTPAQTALIIPVENQVREFDPKLLLACVAAERGFLSVIGSRQQVDFRIGELPRGIYLSKSMTVRSIKMFRILRKLGYQIAAWDEEGLVHPPPETYFTRRMSPVSIQYVDHLFAWGEENAGLLREYPDLPAATPIHVTGNPRGDMLRPEIRAFYEREAEELRKAHGDFLLVNTNFNHVNAFVPVQNLLRAPIAEGEEPEFGRAARGMSRDFALGLHDHKQAIFERFQELIPALERSFPNLNIVVRPHPTEKHAVYREIAAGCERVRVTNEGNVIPWVLATKALVHNGCTTGLEAYLLGTPAVSYRVRIDDRYDSGLYGLPNFLSHQCYDFEELRSFLDEVLAGRIGAAEGAERRALMEHYLAAQDGPLACRRIVAVLEEIADVRGASGLPRPSVLDRLSGRSAAAWRRLGKKYRSFLPNTVNRPEFQQHRYPDLPLEDVRARASRFQKMLGGRAEIRVERLSSEIFQVSA